jgi:hypothetical protein
MTAYAIAPQLADLAETLSHLTAGGFVRIIGLDYGTDEKKWETAGNMDVMGIFGASSRKMKAKEADFLADLDLSTIELDGFDADHLEKAHSELLASAEKSSTGTHTSAQSSVRERFGVYLGTGKNPVWAHFKTRRVGKETQLVLNEEGLPFVESLKFDMLELGRITNVQGVKRPVRSQKKTLAKQAITKTFPKMLKAFKSLTLKAGSFSEVRGGGEVITEAESLGQVHIEDWFELVGEAETVS